MALKIVYLVCNSLFFLAGSVWLGGLVMLAVAAQFIQRALEKRRTEAGQVVRRLRGLFQQIELFVVPVLWGASIALLVLEKLLGEALPGTFASVDAIKLGLLVVPTLASAYGRFYLAGAIRRREAQLGGYADKNEQIRVRKNIAALHAQAKGLTWLKIVFAAALVVVAVVAMD